MISKNLITRMASAALLVPAFLLILWHGGLAFQSLMLLGCLWAGYEWLAMLNPAAQKRVWVFVLFALTLTWGLAFQAGLTQALLFCLITALVLMAAFRLARINKPVLLSMGVSYLGSAMLALLTLRQLGGFSLVAFLCAVVWTTDTSAYFAGRMIKGARLAPDISPSKTWAGFAGGMVGALLAAWFCALLFNIPQPATAMIIGMGLGMATHCGDLFESWVKRQAAVKDSGVIIPGHGGLLDRVDGLIMAVLMFTVGLWASGFNLSWWISL